MLLIFTYKFLFFNNWYVYIFLDTSVYESELILKNLLEIISVLETKQFFHIQEICTVILNEDVSNIELYTRLHPFLVECLSKFPEDCVVLFLNEKNIKV